MCGIIGITSDGKGKSVVSRLVEGLHRLEYRGYDSAGIGLISEGKVHRRRTQGKVKALENLLAQQPLEGTLGIGHTRWATHGVPNERNAHPQGNQRVLVVHNGILENYLSFKAQLLESGVPFEGETDTEVLALMIDRILDQISNREDLTSILLPLLRQFKGSFSCVILLEKIPNLLIAYKQGSSPLAVGYGDGEMFCGSDAIALLGLSDDLTYLEDGDFALLIPEGVTFWGQAGRCTERPIIANPISLASIGKENYSHFMRKEISQQPDVVRSLLGRYVAKDTLLPLLPMEGIQTSSLGIAACGTSYYAGLTSVSWFESFAKLRVFVDIASEFRYRRPPLPSSGTYLFLSQSGETADTLGALLYAREQGQQTVGLVNVPGSSLDRGVDFSLQVHAGPEIGVASTKAFTAQLMMLLLLSLHFAEQRDTLAKNKIQAHLEDLETLPDLLEEVLILEPEIFSVSRALEKVSSVLYLGRGLMAPLAYEGALKLKELSYIHAEGYPGGELKHGPIALLDEGSTVVFLAPYDSYFEKTLGNIQEVAARDASLIILTDAKGKTYLEHLKAFFIVLPTTSFVTAPFVYVLALQLLSYHTACLKGKDVDQPRNLAKSVTVE